MSESTWPQKPDELISYDIDFADLLAQQGDQIATVDYVRFDNMDKLQVTNITHEPDRVQFDLMTEFDILPDNRQLDCQITSAAGNRIKSNGYLIIIDRLQALSSYAVGYTTVERVKSGLGLNDYDGERDKLLERIIRETSAAIDTALQRKLAYAQRTERFESIGITNARNPLPPGGGFGMGQNFVQLRETPIRAVTQILDPDGAAMDPQAYTVYEKIGRIDFRFGIPYPFIDVDYESGYLLPTDPLRDLPDEIEQSCVEIVTALYYAKDRDISIRSESTVDVGTLQYFKMGGTVAQLIDDEMGPGAALAPFREHRGITGIA